MRLALAALTLGLALPAHAASPKPPLVIADHTLEIGQPLDVAGRDCPPNGAGAGYGVALVNGYAWNAYTLDESHPDGTWHSVIPLSPGTVVPGRYTVSARCYDTVYPHSPYPPVTITVLPAHTPRVDGPLTVSDRTVHAGDTVHVSWSNTDHSKWDGAVFVRESRRYLGTFPLRAGGQPFTGDVTIPVDLAPGTYHLLGTNGDNANTDFQYTASTTITVVADEPSPTPTPTPTPTTASPTPSPTPTPEPTTPSPSVSTTESTVTITATDDGTSVVPIAVASGAGVAVVSGAAFVAVRRRRAG